MEFRDIIKKMNDTGSEKKVITESVEPVTEKKLPSLKNIFEALQAQMPIPVVGKEGDKASTQAGFIHIDDTSPAGKAMSQALANLAKDKKAQIVVPAAQQKPGQQVQQVQQVPPVGTQQVKEKAKNPYAIGMAAAKKAAGIKKKHAKDLPKSVVVKGHEIAKKIKKKEKMDEGDIASTKSQDTMGAGLGAGRSPKVLEGSKPDFLDLDKDGNKKESMKKAAADKKKKVKESMNPKIKAAYHEGYTHGLRELACRVKHYQDMEEAKQYFEGYKIGLEECYGMANDPKMGDRQAPVVGLVGENMPASTGAMATQAMPAMEADMEEGNAFTAALAKTPPGGKFTVGGKTFTDRSGYDSKIDEFAFESLDKQLNDLLQESAEPVSEGLSVSMSTGQQGSPDSVSVTGTDDEAGKLLAFIKQVGLGGMGGDKPELAHGEPVVAVASDYGAPKFSGHDDMAALMKKVGVDDEGEDYKDEEGHDHDHGHGAPEAKEGDMCAECGMMEAECGCEKKPVEEVQTPDQTLYATTSEAKMKEEDGDSGDSGQIEMGKSEAEEDEALAKSDQQNKTDTVNEGGDGGEASEEEDPIDESREEKLDEWANNAGGKGTDTAFEQDIEFMTKVISGGLNKPKVTGQTTIPVIAHQDARTGDEDVQVWKKLAGLSK